MKIVSTNIGRIREVDWKGGKITTGIFKEPVSEPLFLSKMGVNKDQVADLKVHGGSDKACYLYSADCYPFWKQQVENVAWNWGIFGENLTVAGLNESATRIGDTYKVGSAVVQVSQPRLPCYKLGIRFGESKIIKKFWDNPFPGVYVRILTEGYVQTGDKMELIESNKDGITVSEVFSLFSSQRNNKDLLHKAVNEESLAESIKKDLRKKLT